MPHPRLPNIHGRILPPPSGEVAQDAQADCDGEGDTS